MLSVKKAALPLFAIIFFINNISAQWQQTSGPKGIEVNVIYRAGTSLYAGTQNKGVYKSTDNGVTWSSSSRGIENTTINDIIYSGGNLLAAVESSCHGLINVFKSADNGISWVPTSGLANKIATSFAIKDTFIYAGVTLAQSGVYRSGDNGNTWKAVPSPIEDGDKIFVSKDAIIVSEFNFIWRSINDGATWQLTEQFAFSGIASFAGTDTTVFAASYSGIYTSINNGKNWKYSNFPGGAYSLSSDTINNIIFLGSNSKVFKSTNEGGNWIDVSHNLGYGAVTALLYDGINLYAATPYDTSGIYASRNKGQNWFPAAIGLPSASTVRSMITLGNYVFAGMQSDGVYRTKNNGNAWNKVALNNDTLSHQLVLSFCTKDGMLFAGTDDGLYRSLDSGITFTKKVNGFPTGGLIFIPSLTVSGSNIVAAASIVYTRSRIDAIFYSSDNGENWIRSYFPAASVSISSVASDGSNIVYAASYGQSFSTTGLYKSYDAGVNFVSKTFSINADIDILAVQGRHVLAGNLFSAFFSPDAGEIWLSSSPPGGGIFTYTIKNDIVFAGNQEGMFYSKNFGATWNDLNQGLPNCPTVDFEASCANNKYLFGGAYLDAAWRLPKPSNNTTPDIIADENKLNSSPLSSLAQNYPNPFAAATQIDYTISKPGMVSLRVYDKYGSTIATLVNELKQSGNYSISFNASKYNLPAGIYYYELKAGNNVESKKMVLIK